VTYDPTTNMTSSSKFKCAAGLLLAAVLLFITDTASADNLSSESRAALRQLLAQNGAARKISSNAIAVLVFPSIVKAGFVFGGQGGEGILFENGRRTGRYRTFAASYGFRRGFRNSATRFSS
jgi:lipid-binding SYLF domain-containing protein